MEGFAEEQKHPESGLWTRDYVLTLCPAKTLKDSSAW